MRCLIVEDDAQTADYIRKGLEECGYEVTVTADGHSAMHLSSTESWDILLLDRMLPDGFDGLSLLRSLRQSGRQTPVLILSALASLDERVRGLNSGGDDYLTKPFAFSELLARIEALTRRHALQDVPELAVGDLRMDLAKRKVTRAGKPIQLQPREFRLLEYLMRHHGQVVTRSMLLDSVWGIHFDPGTNVIDVQISRLRNKIDKGFSAPMLHTIRGAGYMVRAV